MEGTKLEMLEGLISTYKDLRREKLSEKSSTFVLKMMKKELDDNKGYFKISKE